MNITASNAVASALVYCVDLAKNKFQVHSFGAHGARLKQRTLTRSSLAKFFANPNTPRGLVVMEACASAHYWSRWLMHRGYQTKLIPAQFVAKHRIGNKTDGNDADAIYATHCDARVRPVPVKSIEQQDQCSWHRLRARLAAERLRCTNQARGLLAERGCVAAKGQKGFDELMAGIHEREDAEVTRPLLQMLELIGARIEQIDQQLKYIQDELTEQLRQSPVAQNLDSMLGVGVIIATAMAAETGGNVQRYADACQFAASFGITPKEDSSGERRHLGAITKRGNAYLRTLLVQGAQSVVTVCQRRDDALCLLARRLLAQGKRRKVVALAVANRMARIMYAIIKHGERYRPEGKWGAKAANESTVSSLTAVAA